MFNCGVGLNIRGIADEPQWTTWERSALKLTQWVLDAVLFENPVTLGFLLDKVRSSIHLRPFDVVLLALFRDNL